MQTNTRLLDIKASTPTMLPDGTCVIQHGPLVFEIWMVNVNEHYSIQINESDQNEVDVIYLGQ